MKRALALCTALAGIAAGCGSAGHEASSLPGLTAQKLAKIDAMVRSDARGNGDAHPSGAAVYASRRHEANVAAGAGTGVVGEQPVYLVVVHGHFACASCGGPAPGTTPLRGSVMTFVLERKTLRQLDFGFGGRVDTSSLGPGLPLPLG
jgi:hypothetical protein